ncbi:MAG: type II toxin-antitoxin system Phd/YefM family antitoxin [Candidatus Aminicenantes bacterium]|nr:type II toxin-antitoxin system Phd/YefM family antitoxin [Candidatus Aminicenantes bacterium]
MKIAGVREIREKTASYLSGREPFLVTKHGKISGVYVPLESPDRLPDEWRKEIGRLLSLHFAKILESKGVSDQDIAEDFRGFRRRRRGR